MDVRELPGARKMLAARRLPQPDQLCGPYAAAAVLAGLLDDPPGVLDIAAVSGTMIWPHDLPETRPPGTIVDRTGWAALPEAPDADSCGTTATGLVVGIEAATGGRVAVEFDGGPDFARIPALLDELVTEEAPVGVIANIATGPTTELDWDVGHFVVVWGVAEDGGIAVADSYRQLGRRGLPAGCRLVNADAFVAALARDPGRGVLVLRTRAPFRGTDNP